jgi:8-oxo-dGTP pyrophosphatase MutT (NUDIX family)
MAPVPRVGGRLLVFDPDDRVVLVEERLDLSGPDTEWLIPGGGVEPGESPAQAAIRELYEETGILVAADDIAELHTYRRLWSDVERGVQYDQVEHIYLARLASAQSVAPVALTDDERPYVVGPRWWEPDELRASPERFEPADIADLVARARARPRTAGRVLLLDDADRVLLIENTVDIGASTTHWITPGGGADPGETPAQAAVREAFEELGVRIELPDDAEPDHTDHEVFTFGGRWYDQTNHYYVVRLAPGARVVAQGVDEVERSVLVGERWWSLAELRDTDAVIYPVGLVDVLQRLLGLAADARDGRDARDRRDARDERAASA